MKDSQLPIRSNWLFKLMKTLSKKNAKIIGATSMAIFSLVAVFTATIAWFTLNRDVAGGGMKFIAVDEQGRLNKIEIFEYIEALDKSGISHYSFSRTPSATVYGGDGLDDDYFLMGDYNPLHTDHPILILFTLKNDFITREEGDMYIKGLTTAVGFLGETSNGAPKYALGPTSPLYRGTKDVEKEVIVDGVPTTQTVTVDCYPLSSAINFKCADFSNSEYTTIISNSMSGRIDIPTNSITLSESFVNFASSGAGITFKNNPTIYSSPGDESSIQYVAMVVNYDGNAISAIYSTYLGNTVLDNTYGGELYFTCDWSLEVF